MLKATGLIELWSRGFVEPIRFPANPKHILCQQVMALALQERGIERREWFGFVLYVPAFADLEVGDADDLVAWMLEQEILWEESGILWFTRFEAQAPDIEGELEMGVTRAALAREISWLESFVPEEMVSSLLNRLFQRLRFELLAMPSGRVVQVGSPMPGSPFP